MKRFLTTLLVTAVALLAADQIRFDELMFNAVNAKNSLQRALLLIDAAIESEDKDQTALAMLSKEKFSGKDAETVLKKYDILWNLRPHDPDVIFRGLGLHIAHNVDQQQTLEKLKLTSEYGKNHPVDKTNLVNAIRVSRIMLHDTVGSSSGGVEYISTLDLEKIEFTEVLISFLNNAIYRAKVAGNTALEEKLLITRKKLFEKYFRENANIREDQLLKEMKTAYQSGNDFSGDMLFEFYLKKFSGSRVLTVACRVFALGCKDFPKAERLLKDIKLPNTEIKNYLLFNIAVNAKNRKAAKAISEKFSGKDKSDAESEMALKFSDPATLLAMSNDSRQPSEVRAICKMEYAIAVNDIKSYREGRMLFGNKNLSDNNINTIAYTAAKLGTDLDEAEKMLRNLIRKHPHNPAYLDSLGYVCYRKRLYAEAEKYIRLALEKIPSDIPAEEILAHLADIHLIRGDCYNALKVYRRALDMCADKESRDARYIKEKLKELE